MLRMLDLASSLAATTVTVPRGLLARPAIRQPQQALKLYDMENCPHCRIVREVLTQLDIDVMLYPCPKGGERFRPEVVARGGKAQFPFLVDPNTGTERYESIEIIKYLYTTYARRPALPEVWLRVVHATTAQLATVARLGRGLTARPSAAPAEPLELYSFEGSPFARLVRERLCELELPYQLRSLGKARLADFIPPPVRHALLPDYTFVGRNRTRLHERAGKVQVPYLIDVNTGTEMFESADILDYLERTYAATAD